MNYLSVCSGIEAATVAWHPLGWQPLAFSEIEPFPSAVLAHHWPDVPNLGDMTKHHEWPDSLRPDLLVGGTPCQSFSVAGLRKGLADPRGNLALTYLAIAEQYRPEWLVWENVPGVLSADEGRAFGSFLGGLEKLGYGWAYRTLDAQFIGVPQRRRRVFVVGHSGDFRRAAAVLFERQSLSGDSPPSRETGERVAATLERSVGSRGYKDNGDSRPNLIPTVANPLTARMHKGINTTLDEGQTPIVTHSLRGEGFDASEDGTGRGTPLVPVSYRTSGNCGAWPTGDKTDALTTSTDPFSHVLAFSSKDHGADAGPIAPTIRSMGHDASHANGGGQVAVAFDATQITSKENRSNPKPGAPRHPLAAQSHPPAVATPYAVRRLTPTECERLQGFPDGHTAIPWRGKPADQCPDGPRYKALGNSMAVPVMRWIGRRIN